MMILILLYLILVLILFSGYGKLNFGMINCFILVLYIMHFFVDVINVGCYGKFGECEVYGCRVFGYYF